MDWKSFADRFEPMTCILSVEKLADGGFGAVRIVHGNGKYIDSLALAAGGVEIGSDKRAEFIPNSEYTKYIPKDLNFEDVCYRCAVLKEPMHNIVRASRYPFDIMVFMMPLESDDENLGCCTFTQILLPKSDDNLASATISAETALEVINTCIKLREDKPFDEIMQSVIEEIRAICNAEYCSVLLIDETLRQCAPLAQAKSSDAVLAWVENEDELDDDFYSLVESWQDTMAGSFCLVISDEHDMEYIRERNPRWYESLSGAKVKSLVLYPLMRRGQLLGYIMAVNYDTETTQHIKDTLELTTYFIASEIANNRFIDQLKTLGKTDVLTGVMNHNAMNARVSELSEGPETEEACKMGIVFADMNGLKYVNDHQGHLAGDILLKNAAMVLQSAFPGEEIYRAGGDEFLVVLKNTDETDLRQRIEDVKKKSDLFGNVSFAAGYCMLDRGKDIRAALSRADQLMYEDKANCYRMNPKLKRRD
ncbi:MAG: sensor domain-containing diguanylate cyclase [Oscillospiraceae bacterium]|nr:sensor domain-containing diguanylate cyclase [Oscillospiraceae bacterium]